MKNRYFKIEWKQTTGKYGCGICEKALKGSKGFIQITYKTIYNIFKGMICMKCFEEILGDITRDKKRRSESYKLLMKKRILRELKK